MAILQEMMFPLTEEEITEKGRELAALELKCDELEAEKDAKAREYNAELKRLRGRIARLAKEIDEEKALRAPTEAEAPWDPPDPPARGRRRRAAVGADDAGQ